MNRMRLYREFLSSMAGKVGPSSDSMENLGLIDNGMLRISRLNFIVFHARTSMRPGRAVVQQGSRCAHRRNDLPLLCEQHRRKYRRETRNLPSQSFTEREARSVLRPSHASHAANRNILPKYCFSRSVHL